jgi:Ca-activated chloride channel family protein
MTLKLETGYNAYVPAGPTNAKVRLQTVLSLTADAEGLTATDTGPVAANLGIAIDKSGSMAGARLTEAKAAACELVRSLPAHVTFMVVAFEGDASVISPPAPATETNKAAAIQAIKRIDSGGGTAMSTGLFPIYQAFRASERATVALLLTDGRNEGERRQSLDQVLEKFAAAKIPVHARGIGDGWEVEELRHIAKVTGGTADAAPELEEMPEMLGQVAKVAATIAYQDVRLRLQTFLGGQVVKVQQAFPEFADKVIQPTGERTVEVPVGSVAAGQSFDFLIELDLAAKETEEEALVLRPSLVYRADGKEVEVKAPRENWVVAQWSTNSSKTAMIHPKVASVTNQEQLSKLVDEGMKALQTGDKGRATQLLGQAEEQAKKVGNTVLLESLGKVIQRDASGTVRLSGSVGAQNTLRLRSGKTTRLQGGES